MSYINGKYLVEKHEGDVEQFLREFGYSDGQIKRIMTIGGILEVFTEGNKYSTKTSFGLSHEFVLNEEFQEPVVEGVRTIAQKEEDSNVAVLTSIMPNGSRSTRRFEFREQCLILTLSINNTTGRRYYKRV